jgi:DNA-directed RNA polymerase subunit beta'
LKAVSLLIESQLPPELRREDREYTSRGIGDLLSDVAIKYPDQYNKISKMIADVGRNATYWQGETIGLSDLKPVMDKEAVFSAMAKEIKLLDKRDPKYDQKRELVWHKYNDLLQKETAVNGRASGNSIASSVLSGARGKDSQLKMMLTTPGLYQDAKGNTIPMFVRNSFSEGLSPAEFLASTYGARNTVTVSKTMTAKGGDYQKQLTHANIVNKVTAKDCGTGNGIDLPVDDSSLRGRFLAKEVDGIPAGTMIDRSVMSKLEKSGVKKVVARSAMTCSQESGVCAHCVGKLYNQKVPSVGDMVGVTASSAIGEPVVQGSLSLKHTGGIASGKRTYAGFDVLNNLVQMPEDFPDKATVSEAHGIVQDIQDAPQGGSIITIDNIEHYTPSGYELMVKKGDKVEAGDQLSDGIVDPSDIVRLRGMGSGRRYFAERLHQALGDSGFANDKRNVEIISRGLINHAILDDDEGMPGRLPGDMMEFNRLQAEYTPPASTKKYEALEAVGKYLQKPVGHYSVGTKLTQKQAQRLVDSGYNEVYADDKQPQFHPDTQRLRTSQKNTTDWMGRMYGSYLKDTLQESATRGYDTNVKSNPHFAPRLAIGLDFGKNIESTGEF